MTGADQMVDGGIDQIAAQAAAAGHLVQRAGAGAELVEDGAQRRSGAHHSHRPAWNTATASSQAVPSCISTPNAVHRPPISRRWADSVATHGV